MKVELRKTFQFEVVQLLPHLPADHKCRRLHGHSFVCEIAVGGERDPQLGWLMDYADLKAVFLADLGAAGPPVPERGARARKPDQRDFGRLDLEGIEAPPSRARRSRGGGDLHRPVYLPGAEPGAPDRRDRRAWHWARSTVGLPPPVPSNLHRAEHEDLPAFLTWVVALAAAARTAIAAPAVGDAAPDFSLPGSDGKTYKLADFRGRKGVVLAWFPKANSAQCSTECKSLRESGAAISGAGAALFAVSVDDAATNKRFAESLGLDYPVLSDASKETAKAYGVLNPSNGLAQRWTFFIGKDGKIRHIDQAVQPSTHGNPWPSKPRSWG